MPHNRQKKIAVINDFTGFGRCSLSVALPIISAMKLQCCPLPTAIFSNHTEYDSFYCADFTEHMEQYVDEWAKLGLRFSGILTGFLGSAAQIGIVQRFLARFKTEDTVVVMDPVMGDHGALYPSYDPTLARQMRDLICWADVLTPNLTEACILADVPYQGDMERDDLEALCNRLSQLGPKKIVISGLDRGDTLENFIFQRGQPTHVISSPRVGPGRCGTGDVFASILAADAVLKKPLEESVAHAAAFIAKALQRTTELNLPLTDGICFEEFLSEL